MKTKTAFEDLAAYIRLHNGIEKLKLNFQNLYKLFSKLTFETDINFGQAYEAKNMNMIVLDGKDRCYTIYREYGDADENLAYLSHNKSTW